MADDRRGVGRSGLPSARDGLAPRPAHGAEVGQVLLDFLARQG